MLQLPLDILTSLLIMLAVNTRASEAVVDAREMDIVESVLNLAVQNPAEEDFSAADLTWTKFGTAEHHDEVALIPYDRVDAFIIGECSNPECPTRFHIERGRKRARGTLKDYKTDEYLEYKL